MQHQVEIFDDPEAVARAAASLVVETAHLCVQRDGQFSFAVSGGRTPWLMFSQLLTLNMPWENTVIYQVDERVAPTGDVDRNLTHLMESLEGAPVTIAAMPVEDDELVAAAARYDRLLPQRLDLVHLGLGPDGHTASLVPGDAILEVHGQRVALTSQEYQGRRRMSLTYSGLRCADQLLWLVTGADKAGPLRGLLGGDRSIPASRVQARRSAVLADRAALPDAATH